MTQEKRSRWLFLGRFAIYFVVAFVVWVVTTPVMAELFAFGCEKLLFLLDSYDLTQSVVASGRTIGLIYSPSPDGEPLLMNYRNISYSTPFLVALIMAVPSVNPRVRARILLIGLLLLIPFQVFRLVIFVFHYYSQYMTIGDHALYSAFWRQVLLYADRVLGRTDGTLVPLAIWAGLYFYYKWHYKFIKRSAKPVAR